jgi:tripartite-type tricarboxylate transporter receptor subunit TctC
MASNPHLVKALRYDPRKDFTPVAMISRPGFLISINAKSPHKTLADVIAHEKANPGSLSVVIDGPRNATGLTAAYLNKIAGINIRLVPYTSPAQGLQDVIGGNVDLFVQAVGLQLPQIEAGRLRPLAVSSVQREPALPDVQTVGETYPGFALVGWLMISAPTGTPKEAVEGMNRAFDTVLKMPDVQAWMTRNGSHNRTGAGTLAELDSFVKNEIEIWGKAVKAIGLEPM